MIPIMCNMCAEEIPDDQGIRKLSIMGGYESFHLTDMMTYEFSLCEKCIRYMINNFKVPCLIEDLDQIKPITAQEERKFYEERLWDSSLGYMIKYNNGICNFDRGCVNKAVYSVLIHDEVNYDALCEEHKNSPVLSFSAALVKFVPCNMRVFL